MSEDEELVDTGVVAHAPPSHRRDDDKGKDSNAFDPESDDPDGTLAADAWFDDPEGAHR